MASIITFSDCSMTVPANHKNTGLDEPFSLAEFRRLHTRDNLQAVASRHVVYVHSSEGSAVADFGKLAAIGAFFLNPCHNYRY